MSLNIYTSKGKIPKGYRLVDSEDAFFYFGIKDCDFVKSVIKDIDGAQYENSVSFIDSNGY